MEMPDDEKPHLSISGFNMAVRCGEQYRRRYVLGEKIPPGAFMLRGKGMHAGIEHNLRQKINSKVDLSSEEVKQITFDKTMDLFNEDHLITAGEMEDLGASTKEDARGKILDMAIVLAGAHTEHVAPEIQPVAVEERMSIDLGPCDGVGIIDVIDTGKKVRDSKSKSKKPDKDEANNSPQLTFYYLLYWKMFGEPPEQLILDHIIYRKPTKTRPEAEGTFEIQATTRTKHDVELLVERMSMTWKMIQSGIFIPSQPDAWWCSQKWCGYYDTCKWVRRGDSRPAS